MTPKCIITSSSIRQFPHDPLPDKALNAMDIAIGERFSFQLAYRVDESDSYDVNVAKIAVEGPDGWSLRARRVGLVPVAHQNFPFEQNSEHNDGWGGKIPGFVPDPLFDEDSEVIRPCEKHAFWISVRPPKDVAPGKYEIVVRLTAFNRDGSKRLGIAAVRRLLVRIHNIAIEPRKDFSVTHWFYADCLISWYKTNGFDERFWDILKEYFLNIADHGQDVVYVPLFTPSLDKDKIPSQLLNVKRSGRGKYKFDWTDVKKYVDLAKKCGITKFEWCHLASQGGAKNAIRVYEGQGQGEKLLWDDGISATSPVYKEFLEQLLPEFKEFLDKNKLLSKSYFHISDEPHGQEARDAYRAIRTLIVKIAPWFKSMDAISEIEFAREKLIEIPVPLISKAVPFVKEGFDSWCYYCGGPRGKFLNHLVDTPLSKVAMHGFVFYRWPFKGFLHWGLNYWNVFGTRTLSDPFTSLNGQDGGGKVPDAGHGDMFLVYPGEKGPIDSIRWELFAEAMQDYALLQTLNVDRDCKTMQEIVSFEEFPTSVEWRTHVRAGLLRKF